MNKQLKRIMGWVLVLGLGIPSLFGAIWGMGIVRGIFDKQLSLTVVQEVLVKAPNIAQIMLEEAQKPGAVDDPNSAKWLKAAAKNETSLKQMMDESGLSQWLAQDVSNSWMAMENSLRGRRELGGVELNLVLFKKGITKSVTENYIKNVAANLDPCSSDELKTWQEELAKEEKKLPACNPGEMVINQVWNEFVAATNKMPESSPMVAPEVKNPTGFNFIGWLNNWMAVLFIFPVLSIGLGAWLMGDSKGSRLKNGGLITGSGALLALGIALLVKNSTLAWLAAADFNYVPKNDPVWGYGFITKLISELDTVISPLAKNLFDPVINLGIIILVLGIGMVIAGRDLGRSEG